MVPLETPTVAELVYQVDASGRIAAVGEGWDAFARANAAPELAAGTIVGRPMISFIAGAETRHLYDLLTERAVRARRPITVPFRCDAPDARRSMEMRIEAHADGHIEFRTRPLDIHSRAPVALLMASARRDRSTFLRICSWCNRGYVQNQWMEIEDVIGKLGLFDRAPLPELTHGVCETCEVALRQEFMSA